MVLRPGPEQTPISSHHNILNFVYCVYAITKICNWFLCQYNVYNGNISITPENTILKRKPLNFFYKQFLIKFSPLFESKVHPVI